MLSSPPMRLHLLLLLLLLLLLFDIPQPHHTFLQHPLPLANDDLPAHARILLGERLPLHAAAEEAMVHLGIDLARERSEELREKFIVQKQDSRRRQLGGQNREVDLGTTCVTWWQRVAIVLR